MDFFFPSSYGYDSLMPNEESDRLMIDICKIILEGDGTCDDSICNPPPPCTDTNVVSEEYIQLEDTNSVGAALYNGDDNINCNNNDNNQSVVAPPPPEHDVEEVGVFIDGDMNGSNNEISGIFDKYSWEHLEELRDLYPVDDEETPQPPSYGDNDVAMEGRLVSVALDKGDQENTNNKNKVVVVATEDDASVNVEEYSQFEDTNLVGAALYNDDDNINSNINYKNKSVAPPPPPELDVEEVGVFINGSNNEISEIVDKYSWAHLKELSALYPGDDEEIPPQQSFPTASNAGGYNLQTVAATTTSTRSRAPRQVWTTEEHEQFLIGLGDNHCNKGKWKLISAQFVPTKSTTQIASHSQKYFKYLDSIHHAAAVDSTTTATATKKRKRRRSIHDITLDD